MYENAKYTREYFVSYPHDVLVIRLRSFDKKFQVEIQNKAANPTNFTIKENKIHMEGKLEDNELLFDSVLQIMPNTGKVITDHKSEDSLVVDDTDDVIIYVAAKTNYEQKYPNYRNNETSEELNHRVQGIIDKAISVGYDEMLNQHIADYQKLFMRAQLDLGQTISNIPTNELLDGYKTGTNHPSLDRLLEVLIFQYGRYLTIQSSREGNLLPTNLQGIWNDLNTPTWKSDYHININLQMNYWPVHITNLAECIYPLLEYVEALRIPGRITTEIYTGIKPTNEIPENGFLIHTANNPFGFTAPGSKFQWGWSPGTAPWILHNLYDSCLFTNDDKMLRERVYPMLKEEAILYSRLAKPENKTSKLLLISPTSSPEQKPRTNGNAYEQQIMAQLLKAAIKTANKFGIDQNWVEKWNDILKNMKPPFEIGDSGQIKEWYEETKLRIMGEVQHRHLSHLLGFYPMNIATYDDYRVLAGTIVSLIDRGDLSTSWGTAQRLNTWARVKDGEKSYSILKGMISNRFFSNLWSFHPPFQIDGNFGVTAGIAEMLIQSHEKFIHLLPAKPSVWKKGSYAGLVARGNLVFDVFWENDKITSVNIQAKDGGNIRICAENIGNSIITKNNGKRIELMKIDNDRIKFKADRNSNYSISFVHGKQKRSKFLFNLKHQRISHNKVRLTWKNVQHNCKYTLFRKIGDLKPIIVAKGLTKTSFVDKYNYLDDLIPNSTYYINTILANGNESVMSYPSEPYDISIFAHLGEIPTDFIHLILTFILMAFICIMCILCIQEKFSKIDCEYNSLISKC